MAVVGAGAKALLIVVTMVCLLSIGGAMLLAFAVLVPLHWLSARDSGPVATGGWALLAGTSMFEAGWMLTYVATENGGGSLGLGALIGAVTAFVFIRRGADRAEQQALGLR